MLVEVGGQHGHRGVVEQRRQGEVLAEDRLDRGEQLHRQEGVATEGEEVVGQGDGVLAQHSSPELPEAPLRVRRLPFRSHGVRRSFGWGPPLHQSTTVDLAVVGPRQLIDDRDLSGDHPRGEVGSRHLDDVGDIGRADRPADPGCQQRRGRTADHGGGRIVDPWVRGQGGLDVAQLDAPSSELQLVVVPAEELQGAVGQPADPVSGPVGPLAGDEGVGHEGRGREVRATEVAGGHVGTADEQVAPHPRGDQSEGPVHDVGPRSGDGSPDGDREPFVVCSQLVGGAPDGGLGGAVLVVQAGSPAEDLVVLASQPPGAGLGADDHDPDRGQLLARAVVEHQAPVGREAHDVGGRGLGHQCADAPRIAALVVVGGDEGATGGQGPQHHADPGVERARGRTPWRPWAPGSAPGGRRCSRPGWPP